MEVRKQTVITLTSEEVENLLIDYGLKKLGLIPSCRFVGEYGEDLIPPFDLV